MLVYFTIKAQKTHSIQSSKLVNLEKSFQYYYSTVRLLWRYCSILHKFYIISLSLSLTTTKFSSSLFFSSDSLFLHLSSHSLSNSFQNLFLSFRFISLSALIFKKKRVRFSRIQFENGWIGPEWRRRGSYWICNRKWGTRSARTVRRRIRNGCQCCMTCSCA